MQISSSASAEADGVGIVGQFDAFGGDFQDPSDGVGAEPAVRVAIGHHHRRQRAAADATDALDREFAGGIGFLVGGHVEMTAEGFLDPLRTLDVAGGAVADAHDMLAGRLMAELLEERGDTGQCGGRDAGGVGDVGQCLGRNETPARVFQA